MDGSSGTFDLSGFFAWWGQELRGLLPGGVALPEAALPRLTLAVEPDGLRIAGRHGGAVKGPAPEGTVPVPAMMAYLAATKAKPGARTIGLRMPYEACFVRHLELPAMARRDFPRLLELDLERSTPLKIKDVFTDCTIAPAPNAKGLLKVRQLIVKRRPIEGLRSQIEALGYQVTRADCAAEDGVQVLPVNFLAVAPVSGGEKAGSAALPFAMILLALGLMASAVYLYIDRHEKALQALQSDINGLKVKVASQKEALVKAQAAFANIENYSRLKQDTVSKVLLLEELTRLLPDSAWVTDLKMDSSTVEIAGLAASSTALIPILERSSAFMDATSTASLTFDPREEKERYAIRARVRAPSASISRPERGAP